MNYKIIRSNTVTGSKISQHTVSTDSLIFIPENIDSEKIPTKYVYPETTTELIKQFRNNSIPIKYLTDKKPLLRSRKSVEWFGPTILVTYSLLVENPHIISVVLNLLSSYLYDVINILPKSNKVKFEMLIEKSENSYVKLNYNGPLEGIEELKSLVKSIKK